MKYAHANKTLNPHSALLFQAIKQQFFFASPNNKKYAIIQPYSIITDGHDICRFINYSGQTTNGFFSLIQKPWKTKNFDSLIDNNIKRAFFSLFSKVNIEFVDISIHSTDKAFYTNKNSSIVPIYFIVLPNSKLIKMQLKNKSMFIIQIGLNECFSGNLTYIDNLIGQMTKLNQLKFPLFCYPSQLSEPEE